MTYRDDQKAAMARADALQRELDIARRERDEAERANEALEDKLEEAEERARELTKKAAKADKADKKRRRPSPVDRAAQQRRMQIGIAIVVVIGVFGIAAYFAVSSSRSRGSASPAASPGRASTPAGGKAEAAHPMEVISAKGVAPERGTLFTVTTTDDDPWRGAANARVTIVEWLAYDCKFCTGTAEVLNRIIERYPNDVKVVYKPWILNPKTSTAASLAACAAHRQGAFDAMDRRLWDHDVVRRGASEDDMVAMARAVGLDVARFDGDMSGECKDIVAANQRQLASFGISSVPSLFVNGRYRGNSSFDELAGFIDEELGR